MERREFEVDSGKTVLDWVMGAYGVDEATASRVILQGSVWLSGKRMKDPCHRPEGGVLLVFFPSRTFPEYTLSPDRILYEDDDMLAIDKVPGIPSCPTPFSDLNCASWGVEKYLRSRGVDHHVHAVHRLDQPVSGVLLFGKHKQAEAALARMFQDRRVKKLYLAGVERLEHPPERLLVDEPVEWKGKWKEARSFIRYYGDEEEFSFFFASPLTGRPHQLRKHFAKRLVPIVGDAQYGRWCREDRLFLACVYIRFPHPVLGKRLEIEARPNPSRLKEYFLRDFPSLLL